MSTPYLGEIKLWSFGFAPAGWAYCDGATLSSSQYANLYKLLGTAFGGDAQNFKLPDLRGRIPTHRGPTMKVGESAGANTSAVPMNAMPLHQHTAVADDTQAPTTGNTPSPTSRLAGSQPGNLYGTANNVVPMNANVLTMVGGDQVHENRQPYTVLTFTIAMLGVMPGPH